MRIINEYFFFTKTFSTLRGTIIVYLTEDGVIYNGSGIPLDYKMRCTAKVALLMELHNR